RFRSDLISAYLDQMLDWLVRNSSTMRIDRWFLYGLAPVVEPWSTVPVGVALLEPNSSTTLSALGQKYPDWAPHPPLLPAAPPPPTPRPAATAAPSPVPSAVSSPVSSPTVVAYSVPAVAPTAVPTTPPLPTAVSTAVPVVAPSPTPLVARA